MRLNQFLAACGLGSRRNAESLILSGRVGVNGALVRNLATFVEPGKDRVTVDGKRVSPPQGHTYYLLHKPEGVVTTARDPQGRSTVLSLVPARPRVFPVGRLDQDTSGAILLTNDGSLAHRVLHPRYGVEKEYTAVVEGNVNDQALEALRTGLMLPGERRPTAPAQVEVMERKSQRTRLRLVIHEGRNRQVRRMLEAVGHAVIQLRRDRIGPVTVASLPPGTFRVLTAEEVTSLRRETRGERRKPPRQRSPRVPRSAVVALGLLGLLAMPGCAGATSEFHILQSAEVEGIHQAEVSYPSDSLTVRGFLFTAPGDDRRPAVLFNHGGVSGVNEDMKRRGRELARLGYVVFAPTYRGEGGSEGRVEVAAGEVQDVLAAAEILAQHPRVDPTRMAVTGSSHGALVSVLAAARAPDRFRCVVSACGVLDVVTWYRYLVENGFDVGDSLSVAVYGKGPEDRPEAFRVRQAVRVAPAIKIPILIQQGEKDKIVPVEQARAFDKALRDAGHPGPVLRTYPLLGHAFWLWDDPKRHTESEISQAGQAWRDFLEFLGRELKAS